MELYLNIKLTKVMTTRHIGVKKGETPLGDCVTDDTVKYMYKRELSSGKSLRRLNRNATNDWCPHGQFINDMASKLREGGRAKFTQLNSEQNSE